MSGTCQAKFFLLPLFLTLGLDLGEEHTINCEGQHATCRGLDIVSLDLDVFLFKVLGF